jgi:subtilisin family serine protease
MAVAALDSGLQVTFFSNRGINPNGGNVDIAGPGLDVYSSWPMPTRYRRLAGTSMATPHVSGIAALLAEANPAATAPQIWRSLVASARRLPLSSADVGAGLVQAP